MSNRPISHVIEHQKLLTSNTKVTVSEIAMQMKLHRVGAAMIVEDGRLVGIFTERDALFRVIAEGLDPQTTLLSEVMTPHPQTITPNKPLGHALHMMYEGGFRHVPVVDNGHILGIVSARDALGSEISAFESDLIQREHIEEILG